VISNPLTDEEPAVTGVATWIRSHRLVSFFALSYLLGWWAMVLYRLGVWPEPTFIPAAPLVAAIIVIAVAEGRAGFRDLAARMIRWRVPWYWYAVALGLPLAVRFGAALGNTQAPDWTHLAWSSFALAFLGRLVNPMDGPLGEEPGWRGFAVPRMQQRSSPLAAALALGVLVAGWHLPLVIIGDVGPVGLVTTFSITIVYVWLFNRTGGSVLLTLLFHNVQGCIRIGDLGYTGTALARQEFLECIAWSIVAAGVLVLNRSAWAAGPGAVAQPVGGGAEQHHLHHRAGMPVRKSTADSARWELSAREIKEA
jgi:membrane protease YdiL (CAAX protease family)